MRFKPSLTVIVGVLAGAALLTPSQALAQNPFFPKPDLVINFIKGPLEATPGEDLGGRVELTIYNQGIAPAEGGYRIDFFISSDRKLQEIVPGPSESFVEDVMLEGGTRTGLPALAQESTYAFTQQRLVLMNDLPLGSYHICAYIDPDDIIDEEDTRANFLCAPIHIIAGSHDDGHVDEPSAPPPSNNRPPSSTLAGYDSDGDCRLSDIEFFSITDDWTGGSASESLFFSAIDAWMSQSSICTSAQSARALKIVMTSKNILFSASSQALGSEVVVYDAQGQVVFSQRLTNNKLIWNLRDEMGSRVANGVYFVRFGTSELRKIAVIN